ncbi:MAG: hypothetical protein LBC98_06040 [Prevotellaceae bacterium]|nr:hypothetical protein [Prevotellaceae bacterium]
MNITKPFGFMILACMISLGIIVGGCSKYDVLDTAIESYQDPSDLEIADFKNWFKSQETASDFVGTQEPDWDKAEIKTMPDGKTLHVSIEIYKGKNSAGKDSVRKLQIAYVKNSFTGGVKVFSFYSNEYAHANYYSLTGQILEEGEYYAPKQIYTLIERHAVEWTQVRLKSGYETSNSCDSVSVPGTATYRKINGVDNPNAYNCHTYVWGAPNPNDPYYEPNHPLWNNYPDINGSGYSRESTPKVGDRWVSYRYISNYGIIPHHSAIVKEVVNGQVTKLEAKCGQLGIYTYNPNCGGFFSNYITDDIRYYRK